MDNFLKNKIKTTKGTNVCSGLNLPFGAGLISLSKDQSKRWVIIIDESQYLRTGILNDLKLLLNFEIDSKNYASLILAGQPLLNNILSKKVHEALKQKIVMNYTFQGISKKEGKKYILDNIKENGVYHKIITPALISQGIGSVKI
ncbi:MAG: AAA family ATPase [Bacillota bacterium]